MENNNFFFTLRRRYFIYAPQKVKCKKWKLLSAIWYHVYVVPVAHTDLRSTMWKSLFWQASAGVLLSLLFACASRMPVQVNRISSCRPNMFTILPLDIITHSSFVRKQPLQLWCAVTSVLRFHLFTRPHYTTFHFRSSTRRELRFS
jgi:hypothetical protein